MEEIHRHSVRLRAGMYFGAEHEMAENVLYELISNVIDLHLNGQATWLRVALEAPFIIVSDDGPGFPFEQKPRVLSALQEPHDTPTAFGHGPHVHIHMTSGLGLAPIVFASEAFMCTSVRGGDTWRVAFQDGLLEQGPERVEDVLDVGTRVRLKLDPELFSKPMPCARTVRRTLFEVAHLFPGLRVHFGKETFHAPQGLSDLIAMREQPTALGRDRWSGRETFHLQHVDENVFIEAAAIGVEEETQWSSWFNGQRTPSHGVHRRVLERLLRQSGWRAGSAMIHVIMKDPKYAGPTRDMVVSQELHAFLTGPIEAALRSYIDAHGLPD